jgi:Na+/H+ antiporter NhaD/arsenite permease-like protein
MSANPWTTIIIVAITFIGIAIGKLPVIKTNRTTISLIGVALLIFTNQVDFSKIQTYIDFDTIILLFSMMIINANLKMAGFFVVIDQGLSRLIKTPRTFLAIEIFTVGILSALFLNDTICLMFTPFIVTLVFNLNRNPFPYLVALATAANLGSVATLTGNPQNMIIGVASGISYLDFTLALLPIALSGMGVIWLVIVKMYPFEFRKGEKLKPQPNFSHPVQKPLLTKSLVITSGLLIAFLSGAPIAMASFIAASILLVTRRHKPEAVFAEFDWTLLVFFAAMFILSGSLETSGVTTTLIDLNSLAKQATIFNLTLITGVLSNLISNVPAVLLLKPVVASMENARLGWLTIAAASTLAGNLTLLGSVANLIVAEIAERWRIDLNFWEYTKSGAIITILSLAISVLWLNLLYIWS